MTTSAPATTSLALPVLTPITAAVPAVTVQVVLAALEISVIWAISLVLSLAVAVEAGAARTPPAGARISASVWI